MICRQRAALSYTDIGHRRGKPAFLWLWYEERLRILRLRSGEAGTHSGTFFKHGSYNHGRIAVGRYDPEQDKISIAYCRGYGQNEDGKWIIPGSLLSALFRYWPDADISRFC